MQFRRQPGRSRIEVLAYRDRPTLIGSINPINMRFKPSKVNEVFESDRVLIDEHIEMLKHGEARLMASGMTKSFAAMVDHLKNHPDEAGGVDVKAFYQSLSKMLRAMNKCGITRPIAKKSGFKPMKGEQLMFDVDVEIDGLS
ncbi:MAG: hypothetical protein EOP04_33190 [Proteobacteria bacterium]|nr:MAG: hypothetical protein EOP04_33190 [Pseudomonadota bacterium]